MLLLLAACGQADGTDPAGSGADPRQAAFNERAAAVAEAWRSVAGKAAGFVPLQDPTVLIGDPGFDDDTKQAFAAGWYRDGIKLPTDTPPEGSIRYPDGEQRVPLISAAAAYRQLDQGDPPPCTGRPAPPPTSAGPDGSVSSGAGTSCVSLTVVAAELGTVPVRTTRGEATVPAWIFTVEELQAPVARLAVAPAAVQAVPEVPVPGGELPRDLVSAQDLTGVAGAALTYRLGIGACDTAPTALLWQDEEVVVLGGAVTRTDGICTEQLLLEPVTVTLDAPLGSRMVLDAVSGQPVPLAVP